MTGSVQSTLKSEELLQSELTSQSFSLKSIQHWREKSIFCFNIKAIVSCLRVASDQEELSAGYLEVWESSAPILVWLLVPFHVRDSSSSRVKWMIIKRMMMTIIIIIALMMMAILINNISAIIITIVTTVIRIMMTMREPESGVVLINVLKNMLINVLIMVAPESGVWAIVRVFEGVGRGWAGILPEHHHHHHDIDHHPVMMVMTEMIMMIIITSLWSNQNIC